MIIGPLFVGLLNQKFPGPFGPFHQYEFARVASLPSSVHTESGRESLVHLRSEGMPIPFVFLNDFKQSEMR